MSDIYMQAITAYWDVVKTANPQESATSVGDKALRAALRKAVQAERERIATLMELAASGRRYYAKNRGEGFKVGLESEAAAFDGAATIARGGPDAVDVTMCGWVPVHMWTDEMRAAVQPQAVS